MGSSEGSIWVLFSIITMISNAIIPTFTPVLNQYFYGSGIIGSYFLGTALITLLGVILLTLVNGSSWTVLVPSFGLILSGLLYGAGTLSIQKSVERAPSPAMATIFPRNRALVNAMLSFFVFGVAGSFWSDGDIYITQALLVVITLLVTKAYNGGGGEEHSWQVYSFLSMILLSTSDVIVKNVVKYDTILTNLSWFSIFAAVIPLISNYRKTGSFMIAYRDKSREDNIGVIPLLVGMTFVFVIKMVSQYIAIGSAPSSANVRAIGSLAVPLTIVFTNYFRNISYDLKDIIPMGLFSVVGLMSGIRSLM
jgi:drug/metabolite transporter (DMT)-like permease